VSISTHVGAIGAFPDVRVYINGAESVAAFKKLLARACNTWDDAPPEIKELHDRIIHGKDLQDYRF